MNKVSIITVNMNNKAGLKRTVESVINQTYSNIEYLIIDGGSKDGSVEIIKKYQDRLTYWCSEKDNGIYDAMNKGINKSTGDYLLFLNSGDSLAASDAIEKLIESGNNKDIIYGNVNYLFTGFTQQSNYPETLTFDYFIFNTLPHQASLIKRNIFDRIGLYDLSLPISADWKLFLSAIFKYHFSYQLVNIITTDFDMNGMSCQPQAVAKVKKERQRTFKEEFPELLNMINAYRKMYLVESSKLIHLIRKFGFLNYLNNSSNSNNL